jgi:hypothetical protein
MTVVANNNGEFSLGSLNDATPWLPLFGLSEDPGFSIMGTFVGTITFQISYQSDAVKTRLREPSTYTAPAGPLAIPRADGRYFRFIMSAYTSGTAYVGLSMPMRSGEDPVPGPITGQPQIPEPATHEF